MYYKRKPVIVRELFEGYENKGYDGVSGFGGRLDIRPPYQRNFVYKPKQQKKVIDTILKEMPLNTIWWVDNGNDKFEVLDGQQRIISICEYLKGNFPIKQDGKTRGFINLGEQSQSTILNHELMVYVYYGTNEDKLDWFETINVPGMKLTRQEIRNAVYVGPFVSAAKEWFSRKGGPSVDIGGRYLDGTGDNAVDRQGHLQTALNWIIQFQALETIPDYMSVHQYDTDADELWNHFETVINWIETVFPNYRDEMRGVDWGELYADFNLEDLDPDMLEQKVGELLKDDEIKCRKGIWPYVLTNKESYLDLRTFDKRQRRKQYDIQKGRCAFAGKGCPEPEDKVFPFDDVHADHIVPWRDGGRTEPENCQVLCQYCNNRKGAK